MEWLPFASSPALSTRACRGYERAAADPGLLVREHQVSIEKRYRSSMRTAVDLCSVRHRNAHDVHDVQRARVAESAPAWVNFAAGVMAAFVTRTVLIPLDTIKTNMQSATVAQLRGLPWHRRLVFVARSIVKRHGVLGFWRGLPVAVIGNAPAQAVYMATYEALKSMMHVAEPTPDVVRRSTPRTIVRIAIAAALADTVASLVRVPPEVIKQQVQTGQHQNAISALRALARQPLHRGGLYRGFWAQVARDVPFAVSLFVVYESLNEFFVQRRMHADSKTGDGHHIATANALGNGRKPVWTGSVAGTVAAICTMPMDIARTRLMARPYGEYAGVWQAIYQIAREEGPMTLWAGTWLRILYKMPSSTLFLASFDWSRAALVRIQRALCCEAANHVEHNLYP
jgi:solute carrier family 25 S-adenosylmethionine transporter 26